MIHPILSFQRRDNILQKDKGSYSAMIPAKVHLLQFNHFLWITTKMRMINCLLLIRYILYSIHQVFSKITLRYITRRAKQWIKHYLFCSSKLTILISKKCKNCFKYFFKENLDLLFLICWGNSKCDSIKLSLI